MAVPVLPHCGYPAASVARELALWRRLSQFCRYGICHWRTSFWQRLSQFCALWISGCICSYGHCFTTKPAAIRGHVRPRLSLRNLLGGGGCCSRIALREAGVFGIRAPALRQRLPRLCRMATSGCVFPFATRKQQPNVAALSMSGSSVLKGPALRQRKPPQPVFTLQTSGRVCR